MATIVRRKHDKIMFRLFLCSMLLNAALSGMAINAIWKFDAFMEALSERIEEKRAIERFSF